MRLATTGFKVLASTRPYDAVAMRDIAAKLRSKFLAQAVVRNRFFIRVQSKGATWTPTVRSRTESLRGTFAEMRPRRVQ